MLYKIWVLSRGLPARLVVPPLLDSLTRPFYAVFRRFIPPIGNVDLSPIFVLVVAQVLLYLIGDVVGKF